MKVFVTNKIMRVSATLLALLAFIAILWKLNEITEMKAIDNWEGWGRTGLTERVQWVWLSWTHELGHLRIEIGSPFPALAKLWGWVCWTCWSWLGWLHFGRDVLTQGVAFSCCYCLHLSLYARQGLATPSVPPCSSLKVNQCFMTKADDHV